MLSLPCYKPSAREKNRIMREGKANQKSRFPNFRFGLQQPVQLPVIIEGERKKFHSKNRLAGFITIKPPLQKILEQIPCKGR